MSKHQIDFSLSHRDNFHGMLNREYPDVYSRVQTNDVTFLSLLPHIFERDRNTIIKTLVKTERHPHGNEQDVVYQRYGLNEVVPNYGNGRKTYKVRDDDFDENGVRDVFSLKKRILAEVFEVEEFGLDSEFLLIIADDMRRGDGSEEMIVKIVVLTTSYLFTTTWSLTIVLEWPVKGKTMDDIQVTALDGFVA